LGDLAITDEELIARSREGDESAFKELVHRYESLVAGTVIGMLGNSAEAEDVGQETFVRFYQSLRKFRGDSSVGTYIARIAINLSINELKRRGRRLKLFQSNTDEKEVEVPDPRSPHTYDGNQEMVENALSELDPKLRSVVVLRLMDGYTTRETAEILGIPLGTVLSRLSRGQKQLRKTLAPYLEDVS
jgi:RNA polymerase sigma-70 factor (ECF subfamily)